MDDVPTGTRSCVGCSVKHRQLNEHRLRAPATSEIEQLMMLHGDHHTADSEHIEVVANAIASLPEGMQDVLRAVFDEQVPYSELGERLGCSKTQAWRKAQQAIRRVTQLIITNPTIIERYAVYDNWEDAATAIIESYDRTVGRPALRDTIRYAANRLTEAVNNHDDLASVSMLFNTIGCEAVAELKHRAMWQPEAFTRLLCSKQADYGHNNISSFGLIGVAVRLVDKVCRLENLTAKNSGALNEPLLDTWLDMIGYSVIAEMLVTNTFMLPLEVAA